MVFLLGSLDIGSSQVYSLGCVLGKYMTLLALPSPNIAASSQCLLPALHVLPPIVRLDISLWMLFVFHLREHPLCSP